MTIRNATPADLPTIVAIYNAAIPGHMATADTEPVSVESRVGWFGEHEPVHRPLWVAVDGDAILGWLSFQSFYGRPAYRATAELSVYVAGAHRRRGVARALVGAAVAAAPGLGVSTLLAFVFAHNEPSVRLFTAFGFAGWGLLPRVAVLDGVERDLAILGRRVPA